MYYINIIIDYKSPTLVQIHAEKSGSQKPTFKAEYCLSDANFIPTLMLEGCMNPLSANYGPRVIVQSGPCYDVVFRSIKYQSYLLVQIKNRSPITNFQINHNISNLQNSKLVLLFS